MSTAALAPVSGLATVLRDATALHKRDAEMTRRIEKLRRERREQQKLEEWARDCLFAAERAARLFLRDGNDASSRAACAEALVKAGQAMSRTRGLSTLETFLAPEILPPSDTPLGAHLLPLRFLVELLRLGQRGAQEAIDTQLQRLPETPALSRFVEWFEITADFLCGVGEREPGIHLPASVPLPDHDCSLEVRNALLRILYGFRYLVPAGKKSGCGVQADTEQDEKLPAATELSAVGGNTASMAEPDRVADAVGEEVPGTEMGHSAAVAATKGEVVDGTKLDSCVFRQEADYWHLRFAGEEGRIKHRRGLSHLALLLARPDQPLSGADFYPLRREQGAVPDLVSDPTGRRQYRERFEELKVDLEQARRENNAAKVEEIQKEMRELAELLAPYRRRLGNSPQHKSWHAAKTAILRALDGIRLQLPKLSAYLQKTIQLKSEPAIYCPQADPQTGSIRWEI
jgi:hypothetical protein